MDINSTPLVSICCVTYNHQNYIKQCLDGFVMQQTKFNFEILVHEDASTDNTAIILKEYEAKYPYLFRCVYQVENQFLKQNTLQNILFRMVRGKYIAMCEGDDFWTDPLKLQKQIDFLEANPEYSVSFHGVYELTEDKIIKPYIVITSNIDSSFTINDLAKGNFIQTPSVIFRNGVINKLPQWYKDAPAADYVLHMLHARQGKIRYHAERMAVYRKHAQGVWSLKKYELQLLNLIKTIDLLLNEFDGDIKELLVKQKASNFSRLAKIAYDERETEKAKEFLEKAFLYDESLKEQWLSNYYPSLITNLFNSRRYRTVDRFFHFFDKMPLVRTYRNRKDKKN